MAETTCTAIRQTFQRVSAQVGGLAQARADAIDRGEPIPPRPAHLSRDESLMIQHAAQDLVTVRRWQKHRIVYTVDSDLATELAASDLDGRVPSSADPLRQLPHIDPFIALPEQLTLPIARTGEMVRYDGVFVYGGSTDHGLLQTNDSAANRMGLMFVAHVLTPDGRKRARYADHVYSRMSLPVESMPLGDAIKDVYRRFGAGTPVGEMPKGTLTVETLVARIVPMIVYMCAVNAERRTAPAVATRKRADGAPRQGKAPRVVEHGYQLGPALAAARRAAAHAQPGPGKGRRHRPHVRRAHFHLYRTGPGRTEEVVHWLPPIAVNADGGPAAKATVIPVTPDEG